MDFDLDPLDDVLPGPASINTRAGGKFKPKAKAQPRKGTSVSVPSTFSNGTKEKTITLSSTGSGTTQSVCPIDIIQNGSNDSVGSSFATTEMSRSQGALKDNESLVRVSFIDNNRSLVPESSPSQVFAPGDDVGAAGAPPSETDAPNSAAVSDDNGDWSSSLGKKLTNYEGSPSGLQFSHENRSSFPVSPSSHIVEDLGSSGALYSEVAPSNGNGDWVSSFGKSVGEADTMGFDLDPFDDILPGRATSNVRGSGKFQPKAKPQPKKKISSSIPITLPDVIKDKLVSLASNSIDAAESVQQVNVVGNRLSDSVGPSTASGVLGFKVPLIEHATSFSRVTFCDDNRRSEMVNPSGPLDAVDDALHSDIAISDDNGDWNSSYGKSTGENADIFSGLEYLDDFLSQPATLTVGDANKAQPQVNMNSPTGNKLLTSYTVYTDDEGRLSPSEAQNLPPNNKDIEEESEDQVGGREADVCKNDEDFHIDNRRLPPEEVEAFSGLEALDILPKATLASGENLSQSKLHADKYKPSFDVPHTDTVESISCSQDPHLLPSETEYMDEDSIPAFSAGGGLHFSSVRFCDSAATDPSYEIPVNNEDLAENANLDAADSDDVQSAGSDPKIPESENSEGRKRKTSILSQKGQKASTEAGDKKEAGKSSRRLKKRVVTHELVDEFEDEDCDNGSQSAEPPTNSVADEDRNSDDEFKVENSSQKKRAPRKSKKSVSENEKPVRMRKKANETGDKSTKEPPKKFSHSTRRKRRCVDKTLLETPEDEIDHQKLPLRDLIILAEMRERKNKETSSSKVPLANQSADDPYLHNAFDNEWEPGATEQGRASNDDEENIRVQPSNQYLNYQSYMDKTPTSRWSKSETELFYEAVQQFGTDFSMIMQLFPGRTRHQVKLKYKMEERKHPLRLFEASTNRAKDLSHFELVIEQLKQVAAQEKKNLKRENSVDFTGLDEQVEDMTLKTNEGATKSGQNEEAGVEEAVTEDKKTEDVEVGPEKSEESDDDLYRWSQYTSEI